MDAHPEMPMEDVKPSLKDEGRRGRDRRGDRERDGEKGKGGDEQKDEEKDEYKEQMESLKREKGKGKPTRARKNSDDSFGADSDDGEW